MPVIRKEQIREMAEADFQRRLRQFLRTEHAEATAPYAEDAFAEMVSNGVSRARRYGIERESAIGAFVSLQLLIAPNFDEHPRIQEVLLDASVPPDERVRLLPELVLDQDWKEARAAANPAAWKVRFNP